MWGKVIKTVMPYFTHLFMLAYICNRIGVTARIVNAMCSPFRYAVATVNDMADSIFAGLTGNYDAFMHMSKEQRLRNIVHTAAHHPGPGGLLNGLDPAQRLLLCLALVIVAAKLTVWACRLLSMVFSLMHMLLRWAQEQQLATLLPVMPSFSVERMMPNSDFLMADPPKCQAEVHTAKAGKPFIASGQGFLVTNGWFLTAAHVLNGADSVMLKTALNQVVLDASRFEALEADMTRTLLTETERSKLGLRVAKLAPKYFEEKVGLVVSIVAFGKMSMGLLSTSKMIGFCKYTGSTLKGFSGAPYMVGTAVYGMHLGSVVNNVGYESSYILALVRAHCEDTAEEMEKRLAEEEAEILPQPGGGYIAKSRGRYDYLTDETMAKIEQRREANRDQMSQKERGLLELAQDFANYAKELEEESLHNVDELPAGESLPTVPRGALVYTDSENPFRAPIVDVGARGQGEQPKPVPRPAVRFQKEMEFSYPSPSGSSHSTGPIQTPVPLKEVLTFTPESIKKRERNLRRQQKRRQQLQELRQRVHILSGRQT